MFAEEMLDRFHRIKVNSIGRISKDIFRDLTLEYFQKISPNSNSKLHTKSTLNCSKYLKSI